MADVDVAELERLLARQHADLAALRATVARLREIETARREVIRALVVSLPRCWEHDCTNAATTSCSGRENDCHWHWCDEHASGHAPTHSKTRFPYADALPAAVAALCEPARAALADAPPAAVEAPSLHDARHAMDAAIAAARAAPGRTSVDIAWTDEQALMMLDAWAEDDCSASVRSALAHVRASLSTRDVAVAAEAPEPCGECGGELVPTCTACGATWMTGAQVDRVYGGRAKRDVAVAAARALVDATAPVPVPQSVARCLVCDSAYVEATGDDAHEADCAWLAAARALAACPR